MAETSRGIGRLVGAGLLGATAGIHAYLWHSEGYRHVPRIGDSFFVLIVTASVLCLAVAFGPGLISRLAALAGAGLELGTAVVLIIFTHHTIPGFEGFRESTMAPEYTASLVVEIAGFVVLGLLASAPSRRGRHARAVAFGA